MITKEDQIQILRKALEDIVESVCLVNPRLIKSAREALEKTADSDNANCPSILQQGC
jgi:deoxyribose-phosphate aldolase